MILTVHGGPIDGPMTPTARPAQYLRVALLLVHASYRHSAVSGHSSVFSCQAQAWGAKQYCEIRSNRAAPASGVPSDSCVCTLRDCACTVRVRDHLNNQPNDAPLVPFDDLHVSFLFPPAGWSHYMASLPNRFADSSTAGSQAGKLWTFTTAAQPDGSDLIRLTLGPMWFESAEAEWITVPAGHATNKGQMLIS